MATRGERSMSPAQMRLVARHFKALGDAGRLRMLAALLDGERTVHDAATEAGLHLANASKHLQLLHLTGFVERRRDGHHVYYRLAGDDVRTLCEIARRAPR